MGVVGGRGNDLSVSFADSSPERGARKNGNPLGSPFRGAVSRRLTERFVPFPDKSPSIHPNKTESFPANDSVLRHVVLIRRLGAGRLESTAPVTPPRAAPIMISPSMPGTAKALPPRLTARP